MEVNILKDKLFITTQKVLTYISFIIAILIFVLGLGFMTNYYKLFYDGTMETFEFFKKVQILNKAIFKSSLIFIIYNFLLFSFELHKKRAKTFGIILVTVGTIYTILTSTVILNGIAYYKEKYLALDFSNVNSYNSTTVPFELGNVLFIMWIIVSILLLLTTILNFLWVRRKVDRRNVYET